MGNAAKASPARPAAQAAQATSGQERPNSEAVATAAAERAGCLSRLGSLPAPTPPDLHRAYAVLMCASSSSAASSSASSFSSSSSSAAAAAALDSTRAEVAASHAAAVAALAGASPAVLDAMLRCGLYPGVPMRFLWVCRCLVAGGAHWALCAKLCATADRANSTSTARRVNTATKTRHGNGKTSRGWDWDWTGAKPTCSAWAACGDGQPTMTPEAVLAMILAGDSDGSSFPLSPLDLDLDLVEALCGCSTRALLGVVAWIESPSNEHAQLVSRQRDARAFKTFLDSFAPIWLQRWCRYVPPQPKEKTGEWRWRHTRPDTRRRTRRVPALRHLLELGDVVLFFVDYTVKTQLRGGDRGTDDSMRAASEAAAQDMRAAAEGKPLRVLTKHHSYGWHLGTVSSLEPWRNKEVTVSYTSSGTSQSATVSTGVAHQVFYIVPPSSVHEDTKSAAWAADLDLSAIAAALPPTSLARVRQGLAHGRTPTKAAKAGSGWLYAPTDLSAAWEILMPGARLQLASAGRSEKGRVVREAYLRETHAPMALGDAVASLCAIREELSLQHHPGLGWADPSSGWEAFRSAQTTLPHRALRLWAVQKRVRQYLAPRADFEQVVAQKARWEEQESESEEVSEEEYHGCILMTEIEPGEGDY
jgi:hypothetical protein